MKKTKYRIEPRHWGDSSGHSGCEYHLQREVIPNVFWRTIAVFGDREAAESKLSELQS